MSARARIFRQITDVRRHNNLSVTDVKTLVTSVEFRLTCDGFAIIFFVPTVRAHEQTRTPRQAKQPPHLTTTFGVLGESLFALDVARVVGQATVSRAL
jgi:hypothetical protein